MSKSCKILVLILSLAIQSTVSISISEDRLDKIEDKLELLLLRQEDLSKLVLDQRQQSNCIPPQNDGISAGSKEKVQTKRESFSSDLFHLNKLASNSIPQSSSPIDEDELDFDNNSTHQLNGLPNGSFNNLDQQRLMMMKYETMFGNALDNLNSVLKEQLFGFRVSLNKLMNRVIDHSYQYNLISNQMSMIKDECSLAATTYSNLNLTRLTSERPTSLSDERNLPINVSELKTSDLTMLVKLLSKELGQVLINFKTEEFKRDCDAPEINYKTQEELVKLLKRMEEIDSIVKQSALQLSKLNSVNLMPAAHNVITFNNSDSNQQLSTSNNNTTSSRWFSRSKKVATNSSLITQRPSSSADRLQESQKTRFCQSKTSLVKPLSCQQLRLAGANCTGQYYVFVKNSIKHVYCDMNMDNEDDGGGWTLILRRLDKSLTNHSSVTSKSPSTNQLLESFKASQMNFDLNWANYKAGFGYLDEWSEFFMGLEMLNQLTSQHEWSVQPMTNLHLSGEFELQIDVETSESSELHLKFDSFFVANESDHYRLTVGNCNASSESLCSPLLQLNMSKFYTHDRPLNCSELPDQRLPWGWWRLSQEDGGCSSSSQLYEFTRPMGKTPAQVNHLYWPSWPGHSHEPLRKLVMKIRQKRRHR